MSYPTYRQDFEGGTAISTACPELIDFDSAYAIDSSGAHSLTGTHALSLATLGGSHSIFSNTSDTLSGNVKLTTYQQVGDVNDSISQLARIRPNGTVSTTDYVRGIFNGANGISITQKASSVVTTLNTPISAISMPTGTWICLELLCNGTTVSVRVIRRDTGQFFVNTGSGSWSNTPPAYDGSNSGTASTTGAGGYGTSGGGSHSLYQDDWIVEPAVPTIDNPNFSLGTLGATQLLTAGGFTDPLFGVTWSSSATNIATVNSAGLVTAIAAGTATITATGKRDSGQTATATVTVSPTTSWTISPSLVSTNSVASCTAIGVGTSWSGGSPPVFTPSGLATAGAVTVNSSTSATFNVSTGSSSGVITWTDSTTTKTTTQTVSPQTIIQVSTNFSNAATGKQAGYTIYVGGTNTVYAVRTTSGVIEIGYGMYKALPSVPVPGSYDFLWDDTTGNFGIDTINIPFAIDTSGRVLLQPAQPNVIIPTVSAVTSASINMTQPVPTSNTSQTLGALINSIGISSLVGTGRVTAISSGAQFTVQFDSPYQGNQAALTDGTLILSFTSGLNQWHSQRITGGTLAGTTVATLTFTSSFTQNIAVNDLFAIVSN